MSDMEQVRNEVARSRKGLTRAVVALLALATIAGVFVVTGGPDLLASLLSGDGGGEPVAPVAPKPEKKSATEVALGDPEAATPAVEPTVTAEPGAESESGSAATGTKTTSAKPAPTASAPKPVVPVSTAPPTLEQQKQMYWEQVASQEQIGKLVRDEIASFALGSVTRVGSDANVRVTANYRAGGSLSGTMVLRDHSGAWYFKSITRDGRVASTPMGTADTAVMATIVSQQAANQDIPSNIISGGHTMMTIDSVTPGSGTATIGITLSGGSAPVTKGTITCVSTKIGGVTHWFITSFAKS